MAQPTERGPVDIKGVTTRHNHSETRHCLGKGHGLFSGIEEGAAYERVMHLDGTVESYHPGCFEQEFGERRLYGD